MIYAIAMLTLLGLILGLILGAAAQFLAVEDNPMGAEIEALLPGSQCGQCGFPGCKPAAAALVSGEASITLCPPGGRALAEQLAKKLGVSFDPGDMEEKVPMVAKIRQDLCIGCTKCFKRCPTDAILGGPKQIHSIFTDACMGCEKCFDVCPTECIDMRPIPTSLNNWYWPKPAMAA